MNDEYKEAAKKKYTIGIGAVYADSEMAEMTAYALGSCIALCLYEPVKKIGAMAHILLPARERNNGEKSTKYADYAVNEAIRKMCVLGADKAKIVAAMVGGATMFPKGNIEILNIGKMNIESVMLELGKNNIPIMYSVIGGEKSRTVKFLTQGSGFENQIEIWYHSKKSFITA